MSTPVLTVSAELMKNYKQAAIMAPENKFEALQTNLGHSLLFSIGTDGVFYVTQESVGHETGWQKTDLSTPQLALSFPGQSGLTCQTFEAAQSAADGTISLALVVGDGAGSSLFLSLGNSNTDTSWLGKIAWTRYPFDNPATPDSGVRIANVLLSETADSKQYIVVDTLRDPSSPEKLVSRYYLNPAAPNGQPVWQPHDVAIDLEAASYVSCLGRQYLPNSPHQPTIDGLYTAGQVDGHAQFTFQPLYDVFNPQQPAAPARLQLPEQAVATSLAACRLPNLSTDLYACSGNVLYYFASSNQADEATAVQLVQDPAFEGVTKLYAARSNNATLVWGLNGNDELFYLTCPAGQEQATPSAWSRPLPILTGVDMFSPYLDVADQSNTFFAVAGNTLQKLVKSPATTLWRVQSIALPSPNAVDTQEYDSYTTRILVTDSDTNQALAAVPVTISAATRAAVYINHLYYVLGPEGVQVDTDELGSITVIEWVSGLTGTPLSVSAGAGATTEVNPMDAPFAKLSSLTTAASLQSASITQNDGTTRPLVSSSVSAADLAAVAQGHAQLGLAYSSLPVAGTAPAATFHFQPVAETVEVDAGDLFSLLRGAEALVQVVHDEANQVWRLAATIADQAYTCLLDIKEKVIGAAEWVIKQIKVAVKDLLDFLKFLFNWPAILTTHRVMKNVFVQVVQNCVDSLAGSKTTISSAFANLQTEIDTWADIPDFDQTPAGATTGSPALTALHSAPAQVGVHHYQGNAAQASSAYTPAAVTADIFQDLLKLLDEEGDTLSAAYSAIKTDIVDQFQSLSLKQVIQKFVAIATDTLLQTAENILLAAIDVLVQLTEGLVALLTTPLDIPVLSWLYQKITGDALSFLDLVCFIAAIPATIVYELATGDVPFPAKDALTTGLLAASSFAQVQQAFNPSAAPAAAGSVKLALSAPSLKMDDAEAPAASNSSSEGLKAGTLVAGIFAAVGGFVLGITTGIKRAKQAGKQLNELLNQSDTTLAVVGAAANVAYVAPNIVLFFKPGADKWYEQMVKVLTGISITKGILDIVQPSLPDGTIKKISPFIKSGLGLLGLVPPIAGLVDHVKENNYTHAMGVAASGNLVNNLASTLEWPLVMIPSGTTVWVVLSTVQIGLMETYGVLMFTAGIVQMK